LADYNQNIKVTADTKQAEKEISKLDQILKGLSQFTLDVGKGAASGSIKLAQRNLKDYGQALGIIDRQLGGFGKRLGEIAKAFDFGGKTVVGVASINALAAAAAAAPRALGGLGSVLRSFGGSLEALTSPVNAVTAAIQAMGPGGMAAAGGLAVATAAFMAFSPAVKKVVSGLDNLVLGGKIKSAFEGVKGKVDETKQSFFGLNTEIKATVQALNALAEGMSLSQLNKQVSSLTKEMQSFHSSTEGAWTAAQGLVRAQKAQVAEQKALNDLVRQARGLQSQDVRDTEVSRRMALLTSGRNAQKQMAAEQARLNTELEDYARLAAEVAAQTKAWADNLTRVERSSKAGVLGNKSQIQARLEEFRSNKTSADIAREQSAAALALEARQQAARQRATNYGLNQVPVRGQLAPAGNTMAAFPQYREFLNQIATVRQAVSAVQQTAGVGKIALEAKATFGSLQKITAEREKQLKVDQQSIAFAKERNKLLMEEYRAEQRVANGTLDRRTRLADLRNKKKKGEELQGRVENTLVSGAFPLLFGAGPLATIGGFAGGALGSKNPMIGVFTSAIGQLLDTYIKSLTDLASSLKSPTDALTAMEAAGLKVSDSLRYTVEQLSASGRGYEAQARVIAELNRRLGTDTTQSLFALYAEQKKLTAQWDQAVAALQSEVIPAVTGAVTILNIFAGALRELAKVRPPKWMTDFLLSSTSKALTGVDLPGVFRGLQGLGINAGKGAQPPALDLKGQEAEIDRRVQSAAQERQLRQQGIDLERSAVDLRLNAEEAVYGLRRKAADIERSSIELRQSIEDAIFSKRQELARAESDNLRRQAQLSIERLDLSLSQIGKGDPTSKFEGSQLVTAAREYLRVRGEGEADLAQKERELKLKLADIDRDGTKFRLDVSKKSADLQLQASDYQRDVAKTYLQLTRSAEDYKVKVAEYQYAMAQRTYELAKQTGDLQQIQAAATPLTGGGATIGSIAAGGLSPETRALLKTIRFAEGTAGANGYTTMFTGRQFSDMSRHPRQINRANGYASDAAGAYQFLSSTWDSIGGGAMTPERQDRGAVALIRNRGVNPALPGGFTRGVADRLAPEWASFPTARTGTSYYGQGGKSYETLKRYYDQQLTLERAAGGAPATQMSPIFQRPGASTAPVPVVVTGTAGPTTAAGMPTAPTAPGIPALPAAPKLADISGVLNVYTALVDKSKSIEISSMELVKRWKELVDQKAAVELGQRFDEVLRKALGPMNEIVEDQKNSAAYQREYGALLADGVLPALAEQLAKIKQTYTQAKELLDYEVLSVEAAIAEAKARGQITTELEKELALLKEKLGLLDKQKEKAEEGAKKAQSPGERLQGAYDKVQGELNALLDPVNQVTAGANAIGSAFGQAFKDVASGAKTAQQALADAFQGIANHFLDMASQMIAKWIEMQIIGLAMNILGAAAGAAGGAGWGGSGGAAWGGFAGALQMPALAASGGSISATSPTIVGERGPELFVPGQSGGITNHQNLRSLMASGGGGSKDGGGTTMNMSFETTQFMDREWVDRQQLETAMATASKQGAAQGERRALDRLRQSPRTRRSVGI
jgi:muramidase (phage lysozyme)